MPAARSHCSIIWRRRKIVLMWYKKRKSERRDLLYGSTHNHSAHFRLNGKREKKLWYPVREKKFCDPFLSITTRCQSKIIKCVVKPDKQVEDKEQNLWILHFWIGILFYESFWALNSHLNSKLSWVQRF